MGHHFYIILVYLFTEVIVEQSYQTIAWNKQLIILIHSTRKLLGGVFNVALSCFYP